MPKQPPPKLPKKPKRPRGRPVVRVIEQIDASPKEIVEAVFRVADRERDERLESQS